MLSIAVILPAAGQSKRFGTATSSGEKSTKLTAQLGRKAVLVRSAELFANRPQVKQIIVAADPDDLDTFKFRWADKLSLMGAVIVAGGRKERWETVSKALKAVGEGITHVAIHDAARPVTNAGLIDRLFEAAAVHPAVIPALPVHATLKRIEDSKQPQQTSDPLDAILGDAGKKTLPVHRVLETVPRAGLWTVQTPQVFELRLIRRAYDQIAAGKLDLARITDDAMLVESLGEPVVAVEGDPLNVKITVPDDLKFAEAVLAMQAGKPAAGDPLGPKRKHPTWAQMDEDL